MLVEGEEDLIVVQHPLVGQALVAQVVQEDLIVDLVKRLELLIKAEVAAVLALVVVAELLVVQA